MKIDDLLVKPLWKRRLPKKYSPRRRKNASLMTALTADNREYETFSQADFLDELYPSSHIINSLEYRSPRIKYRYNPETKKNDEDGFEPMEVIPIALQEGILRHKVTHTYGNDMWFGAEGKDEANSDLVSIFKSHWNVTGMKDALNVFGRSLFGTGDSAIYLYRDGDIIKYKVFSYEKGDLYTTGKDQDGNNIFIRLLIQNDKKLVEIYGHEAVEVWKQVGVESEEYVKSTKKSEDGYILLDSIPHGAGRCPVIYERWDDVVWGPGQKTIEHIEKLASDLAENNRYYAYQILFVKGGVMSLPGVDSHGKVIASKTADGDAKILEPADASNTFTIDFVKNLDLLWESTGTVVIEPKELKAGENTGAFIKNLYWREVQWSTNAIAQLRPTFQAIIDVFKYYVGNIENKSTEYNKMRMSYMLEPFVPQNISEEVMNICQAVGYGITSKETASGELAFNNPQEYRRLQKETAANQAHEKELLNTRFSQQNKANEQQGLDNNAKQ